MPFADLVLEGGGVKGIALAGAITVLMERGYEFQRVAGTSAGAIVGALVAAGFDRDEIEQTVTAIDYHKFKDGHHWNGNLVGDLFDVALHQGVYRGEYLKSWLGEQLARKDVRCFDDLTYTDPDGRSPKAPDQGYRLVVNVSDVTAGCLRQLPWDYREHYQLDPGDEPVVDAVRCSMSIPFFYRPAAITTGTGEEHVILDGGWLSNFPVDLFDPEPGLESRWPTFGIKLSSKQDAVQLAYSRIHGTVGMTRAILSTMTGFYDRMHVASPEVADRTIFVDTQDISSTDFDLTPQQRDTLFANGRQAALDFLDGTGDRPAWDWNSYQRTYGPST
jgi:NTE family protein